MYVELDSTHNSKLLNKKINYIIHDKMLIDKYESYHKIVFIFDYGKYVKLLSYVGKYVNNKLFLAR